MRSRELHGTNVCVEKASVHQMQSPSTTNNPCETHTLLARNDDAGCERKKAGCSCHTVLMVGGCVRWACPDDGDEEIVMQEVMFD